MTEFSVLICTYNRHDMLGRALNALIRSTTEPPDEVVVVNGGDTRADEIIRGFQNSMVDVKLVKTINKNLAASRNVGLPYCNGNIIAMTDDDAQVLPDWVTEMKRAHQEHPEAGAIGGAVIGADSGNSILSELADLVTFRSPSKAEYVRTLPGVNIAYKREAVQLLGAQDEMLFRGEDVDYNWRLQQLGYRVFYDPKIRVIHHHRPTLQQFYNQHYMYGRAYYLVRSKWPKMYCIYPQTLDSPRNWLKLANFIASTVYEPLRIAMRLTCWRNRLVAIPILTANGLLWRIGMMYQMVKGRGSGRGVVHLEY